MKPWFSTEGVVVFTDGTIVDWDEENFDELRLQVENSPSACRYKGYVIDGDVCDDFEGNMYVYVMGGTFGIKLYSSRGTFYSPL